jgi:RecJ-like exonuclease
MSRFSVLEKRAEEIAKLIINLIRNQKTILIIGHLDADGITSASLIGKAIYRKRGRFIIRIYSEMNDQVINELKEGEYDFHIFCELGGGMTNRIIENLDNWILIDHHQITEEEKSLKQVFNAWQFGFDGNKEISAAGMAYFIAKKIDEYNTDLSWLPVIAMFADRQDQGERRSVEGPNKIIIEDAVKAGLIEESVDLLLFGRETKPVHEALASTTSPFIPSLSGNRDTCLATLTSTGIKLKQNGRWRTLSDLDSTEKKKIVESLIPYFSQLNKADEAVDSLFGKVYTLLEEDEHSPLRDAREFGTFLNACGRMKYPGIGVSICLSDRGRALQEGENVLRLYRQTLSRLIQKVLEDDGIVIEKQNYNMVIGDGFVDEDIVGALASILSGLLKFNTKVLLVRTAMNDHHKISVRRPSKIKGVNLGLLIKELVELHGGTGGGHEAAAGCKIPSLKLKQFLTDLNKKLQMKN